MEELEDIRLSKAANSDQHIGSLDGTEIGPVSTSETVVATKVPRVFVSTRPRHPQDEPLVLTLEEIKLFFWLMSNLGEIPRRGTDLSKMTLSRWTLNGWEAIFSFAQFLLSRHTAQV
ncbi:hypothetical protein BGX26_002184 [Mortierella sp. AD094]|nr:hypothetical protein BGX26_002184 [Mortierella sp. AD094]